MAEGGWGSEGSSYVLGVLTEYGTIKDINIKMRFWNQWTLEVVPHSQKTIVQFHLLLWYIQQNCYLHNPTSQETLCWGKDIANGERKGTSYATCTTHTCKIRNVQSVSLKHKGRSETRSIKRSYHVFLKAHSQCEKL